MLTDGASAVHRTQIYLQRSQYEILRARARKEGKSMAAVIREILDEHFCGKASTARRDPLHRVIGIGEGDGSAVAENSEDFLYGEKS
jgi:hypothetical protein